MHFFIFVTPNRCRGFGFTYKKTRKTFGIKVPRAKTTYKTKGIKIVAIISGQVYRFTNAQFPGKALNVYASGTTISARRNVCLYDSDATDVMQQWVVTGNETDGYFLKCNASTGYALHYATGADSGSCAGNTDVKNGIAKFPTDFLVDFIYLGNNQVKIKRRGSNEYLTAYNDVTPTSNTITTKKTDGNVYWSADNTLGNKQVWNISPSIDEEDETEGQKLVLPINYCKLNASYKNATYKQTYNGATHYGIDIIYDKDADPNYDPTTGVRDRTVRASGNGIVIAKGWDGNLGYVIVIKYPNAYHKTTETYKDVIVRYCHFNSIDSSVVEGASVNTSTVLGVYGGSGYGEMNHWPAHLHIEMDEDKEYPCYSPTLGSDGYIIYGRNSGANDSTMSNPLTWLYIGNGMTYTTAGDAYINSGDETLESI